MRAGFGGYVTGVKHEGTEEWRGYCAEHGRTPSYIPFDENEGFNFLDYEMARHGMDGINTVVESLMHIVETSRLVSGGSARGGEAFWQDAPRQPLRYALPVLYAANGVLTIPDILRFITTAPATPQEVTSAEWQKRAFMYETMDRAARFPKVRMSNEALQNTINYWAEQWPAIPDKTRGNIVVTLTAALDRFNHGRLKRAFCGKTTIVPEMSFHGAVIVDAKSTLTWNEDAIIAQKLFKFFWQRAVLSRNSLEEKHRARPVFLFCDEAQETVSSYDGEFLGMCRASKCCMLYMTQSLPAYFSKIGGDNPRDAAVNLVGKFGTQVFFANGCAETNEYAARTIGKVLKRRANYSAGENRSTSYGMNYGEGDNRGSSTSWGQGMFSNTTTSDGRSDNWGENRGQSRGASVNRGYSETMEYAIEPGDFARCFRTGGAANNYHVTGLWFRAGEIFRASGTNVLPVTFSQK